VVEHKKVFSCQCHDQITGDLLTIHTNRIEGAWKHTKDYFRCMNGTKVTQFESHICELMWRWWDRTPRAEAILRLIKEFYPLNGPPVFTAGYPVFATWSRQSRKSIDDSMSRIDSSEDEDHDSTTSTSLYITLLYISLEFLQWWRRKQLINGIIHRTSYTFDP